MARISDTFQTKNVIARQQRKLRNEMKNLVKMRATCSKYSVLNRQEKRRAEYHHDRVTEEKSLQEDARRAETMANRIGQVLEQLRKDFNKMKNFAGNYNFTNTVGMDSQSSGTCQTDLTTAIDTRQGWKNELKNLIEMTWHYVDAQYLGNYAILHTPPGSASNGTCNANSCCPLVYRSAFHYVTPAGDCMSMPTSAGISSGNSEGVTNNNIIDTSTDSETIEVIEENNTNTNATTSVQSVGEQNIQSYEPNARNHNKVTNCNLAIRTLFNMIINADEDTWVAYIQAEINKALAEIALDPDTYPGDTEKATYISGYLLNTTCLPESLVNIFTTTELATNSITSLTNDAKANLPTVDNVEDETDLQFIIKMLTERMNKIRKCQLMNDREKQRICYVRETSECNQAYHTDEFQRLTAYDESEVEVRSSTALELSVELDKLNATYCVTKQSFFKNK